MMEILRDKRVFLDYGPIQMVLDLSVRGRRSPIKSRKVAERIIEEFENLVPWREKLKNRAVVKAKDMPTTAEKMINAASFFPGELTPMAAVAGAFSDTALEVALETGADRVIINNGGDIALADTLGGTFNTALPLKGSSELINISVDTARIRGICTSGLGGRGFTRGVASAAVVLASSSAVADACATYIGNFTCVESGNVLKCPAEELDVDTDIAGEEVTFKVGFLDKKEIYRALLNGLKPAERLYEQGIIEGVLLQVSGETAVFPEELAQKVAFSCSSGDAVSPG